ncbi:MAG TPA: hypothetical protein VMF91_09840 [Bryobacteraceae bacterium]|nr:hypothetical protein [Bryobacteraceae bacterium]
MPTLSKELRRTLENVVADARRLAEAGAEQALKQLAVHDSESWPAMTSEEKALREKLRAHGKQLGDKRGSNRTQEIARLRQACAYEHWHRMLFARFLAENDLLIHPDYGEPLSLDEVRELARERNEDWLSIAASFAQRMLLEVFRADDPVLQVVLPPETRQELEEKLASLPSGIFTADDSLGWVYQFWQRDQKDAVNKSEVKIGADELAAVTQLFTEDYMVLFLLENTLGAWWSARRRNEGKDPSLTGYNWKYLRLNEDGTPSGGSYDTWPQVSRDIRLLDPCMGSGHFLTFALPILVHMRVDEEGLTLREAVTAVLKDNLFGLELDARCSQIAAFNLAFTAWRLVGGHMRLPTMNLACSGLGINASKESWISLAGDNGLLRDTLAELYAMFQKAPTLGSLINPTRVGRPLLVAKFDEVWPLLEKALAAEQTSDDSRELAIAAQGVLAATRILAGSFSLVATNVPYIARRKQASELAEFCAEFHSDAAADLATCFLDRCLRFCDRGGTAAVVTPQSWLFLTSYKELRRRLIKTSMWDIVARLGPRAFETISGEVVHVALLAITNLAPPPDNTFAGVDLADSKSPSEKSEGLRSIAVSRTSQNEQLKNPDFRIVLSLHGAQPLLGAIAKTSHGQTTFDSPRFNVCFWEMPAIQNGWVAQQSTPESTMLYGGCHYLLRWEDGRGGLAELMELKERAGYSSGVWKAGVSDWGRRGVIVGQMHDLPCSLYMGCAFDDNASIIVPSESSDLAAIWCFCSSPEFNKLIRQIDSSVKVTSRTLVKVPFDLAFWQERAREDLGAGLPEPHSDDPTQWLFSGHPNGASYPLQVAVARLVGYHWPRQTGSTFLSCAALGPDELEPHSAIDGIVCLNSIGGASPAAERLRSLLAHSYGAEWSATKLATLLGGGTSLEAWLRDEFFEEHCVAFQNRPFVWHVWDGRKDGFHAFVNYHKLAAPNGHGRQTLEKLIYTAIGDWITRQTSEVAAGIDGADARLSAAKHLQSELENILSGESPYDIFARWKPIHEQPIGWEPDLDDGVRVNIRPWLTATLAQHTKLKRGSCILRVTPKIAYGKDRGKEPTREKADFPWFSESADRNNDIHLSLDEKRAARERRKK